jgi:hypothetical protein
MKTLAYTQTIKQKLCYGVSNHQMWFEFRLELVQD